MEKCDTLLMVGTFVSLHRVFAEAGRCKGVQIELDPKRIGLRFSG